MKSYAKRMSRLGTESAFAVLDQVKKLEAEGKDIISFCIGEPDFDTPKNIREAGKKAIDDGYTHYGPSGGLIEARQSYADYLNSTRKNVRYGADEIVITPGGKPIIFYAAFALVDEGDEVIYPNPGFPIYESMINFVGAKAVPLPLLEEKEFVFDVAELERLIGPNTKMLILNSPQNPCGGVIQKDDLARVAQLAVRHDLWVLSDEIYSRIIYGEVFESITQFPGMKERTIILEGHSKTYAMTGWRLGYGAMPRELAAAVSQLMANSNSCTAAFTQLAGVEGYKGPQDATAEMVKRFQARRDIIVDGLNGIRGIRCLRPRGSFYVFPNVTEACKNMAFKGAVDLQEYLLNEAGVAVLARSCFGARNVGEHEEYIRLSYATGEENIREGLKRIKAALEK